MDLKFVLYRLINHIFFFILKFSVNYNIPYLYQRNVLMDPFYIMYNICIFIIFKIKNNVIKNTN